MEEIAPLDALERCMLDALTDPQHPSDNDRERDVRLCWYQNTPHGPIVDALSRWVGGRRHDRAVDVFHAWLSRRSVQPAVCKYVHSSPWHQNQILIDACKRLNQVADADSEKQQVAHASTHQVRAQSQNTKRNVPHTRLQQKHRVTSPLKKRASRPGMNSAISAAPRSELTQSPVSTSRLRPLSSTRHDDNVDRSVNRLSWSTSHRTSNQSSAESVATAIIESTPEPSDSSLQEAPCHQFCSDSQSSPDSATGLNDTSLVERRSIWSNKVLGVPVRWIVVVVGCLLIITLLGYMLYLSRRRRKKRT